VVLDSNLEFRVKSMQVADDTAGLRPDAETAENLLGSETFCTRSDSSFLVNHLGKLPDAFHNSNHHWSDAVSLAQSKSVVSAGISVISGPSSRA